MVKVLQQLGQNKKLMLTGRPPRPIGVLGTCKVIRYETNHIFAVIAYFYYAIQICVIIYEIHILFDTHSYIV